MEEKRESIIIKAQAFMTGMEQLFKIRASFVHFSNYNKSHVETDFKSMTPAYDAAEDVRTILGNLGGKRNLILCDYGSGIGNLLFMSYHMFEAARIYGKNKIKYMVRGLWGFDKHASINKMAERVLGEIPVANKKIKFLDFTNIINNVDDKVRNADDFQYIVYCNAPFKVNEHQTNERNFNTYRYLINLYPKGTIFVFPNNGGFVNESAKYGMRVINNRILKKSEHGRLYK